VAGAQVVVEERERLLGSERGEPQRQARQVHGHGIHVHTEEAPLRHEPPEARAIDSRHVRFVTLTLSDEGRLVCPREEAARRHEKRPAAHRGIDDTQRQDALRGGVLHEVFERLADEESRDWTRRVERAGCLAPRDIAPGQNDGWRRSPARRSLAGRCQCHFVIEKALVHGPELLDTQVAIRHALAATTW
jgi:hypothetical protein